MSTPLRILFLEDNAEDAELIGLILRKGNIPHLGRRVESPAAFREALTTFAPDIILADYSLTQFSGLDALKIKEAGHAEIPFILVTGTQSEEIAVMCMCEGAEDYVLKSSLDRLPSAVKRVLDRTRSQAEARRTADAMRARQLHYQTLIEHSVDAMTLVDATGIITSTSSANESLTGFRPDEFAGHRLLDFIHHDDRAAAEDFLQSVEHNHTGVPKIVSLRIRHQNGEWRWMEMAGSNLLEESSVKAVVLNYRDITKRKEEEVLLLKTLREKEILLEEIHERVKRNLIRIAGELPSGTGNALCGDVLREIAASGIVSNDVITGEHLAGLPGNSGW